jgi:hypothetical protein
MPIATISLPPHEFENRLREIRDATEGLILACRSVHWSDASDDAIRQLALARQKAYSALVNAVGRDAVKKATRPRKA